MVVLNYGSRAQRLLVLGLLLLVLVTSLVEVMELRIRPSQLATLAMSKTGLQYQHDAAAIPNLVHYVWLLKTPGSALTLNFQHFISIYSSHLYLKPDAIYIHTDARLEDFEYARQYGDPWTRRTLAIPGLVYHQVEAPTHTRKGVEISLFEHRSDFARTAVLAEYGGLYQDFDSIPLRDIAPLRKAGFANVVGRENGAGAINGAMLCAPHSALIDLYLDEQHNYFNGDWNLASIILLGELAFRLQAIPNEVLVLADEAFTPVRWDAGDALWIEEDVEGVTDQLDTAPPLSDNNHNMAYLTADREQALAWWQARRDRLAKDHVVDFSKAYLMHAFSHGGEAQKFNLTDPTEFIMRRKSNYARAVYPAFRHAMEAGLIPMA